MDQHTECLIQDTVTKLRKEKTCLLIAHRLSTVRNADRIVVLADCGVAEVGTHDELMAKRGMYYDIYSADIES
jgi:ATP-binding cassette subfamily B protein